MLPSLMCSIPNKKAEAEHYRGSANVHTRIAACKHAWAGSPCPPGQSHLAAWCSHSQQQPGAVVLATWNVLPQDTMKCHARRVHAQTVLCCRLTEALFGLTKCVAVHLTLWGHPCCPKHCHNSDVAPGAVMAHCHTLNVATPVSDLRCHLTVTTGRVLAQGAWWGRQMWSLDINNSQGCERRAQRFSLTSAERASKHGALHWPTARSQPHYGWTQSTRLSGLQSIHQLGGSYV